MDQTQLQEKIALYYKKLPEETKVLFAGMSWIETLQEINVKYSLNEEQIKTLGTETTILLLGIISLEDYVQTLKTEVQIENNKTDQIIDEIGQKILKDIAPLLYDSYSKNVEEMLTEKFGKGFDERISSLSPKIQEAINNSNYQSYIYTLGNKYSLNIDQIGILEEITTKVMTGILPPDKYESEIKSKISIEEGVVSKMMPEINENIFKNIKELLKENWNNNSGTIPAVEKKEDVVPLPPYKVITNDQLLINNDKKVEEIINHDEYKEHGIEILSDNIQPVAEIKKEAKPINIFENKLSGNTISNKTVSDYSIPKINQTVSPTPQMQGDMPAKPHDPYHEAI